MSFLTPLALGLALLAVPIVLLYMLRLRRRPVEVSSILLWVRLMQDREANAPWQRLRRNILLFLQLLILAALVLALARPFRMVPAVGTGSVVVLLDASASMNARDVGTSRFSRARALADKIVERLGTDSTMTVIEVGPTPRVLLADSADKAALHAALDAAKPSLAQADWDAALTLAVASAQGSAVSTVVISDGGLPEDLPTLPGELQYIPVGAHDTNLAITALSARPVLGSGPELFAQITNFGTEDVDVIFSLRLDGADEIYYAASYSVPSRDAVDINIDDLPPATQIHASLTRPAAATWQDYLALDDEAWAVYTPPGAGRVLLVTEGNVYIEQLLLALPGVQSYSLEAGRPLPIEPYDLYIFDSYLPDTLPPGDLLIIGPQQSTEFFEFGGISDATNFVQVETDDPRMAFVTLNDLHLADFAVLDGVDWATVLAQAEGGPLILAGETGGRQIAIITFSLYRSDLPLQLAWPVLVANLLEWFAPARAVDAPDVLRPAESVLIRPALAAERVEIAGPDGAVYTYPVSEQVLSFDATDAPGIYTVAVSAGDATTQKEYFAVNLFAAAESDITPRSTVTIGTVTLEETTREAMGQEEYWPWVALVGFGVLVAEWYVYHRGLRIPRRRPSPLRRVRH